MTKWYNGFSPEERVRGWQVSHWLQELGEVPRPLSCSICDSKKYISYHNENYYTPWNAYSVCKRCHYALHNRHRCPDLLQRLLTEHGAGRGGWLNDLSAGGAYDLATEIRAREGSQIAYIENYLPNNLSSIFPKHQLHPLQSDTVTQTSLQKGTTMTDKKTSVAIMQLTDKTVIYGTKLALEELGNAILSKAQSVGHLQVTLNDYKNTPVQILHEHELPD